MVKRRGGGGGGEGGKRFGIWIDGEIRHPHVVCTPRLCETNVGFTSRGCNVAKCHGAVVQEKNEVNIHKQDEDCQEQPIYIVVFWRTNKYCSRIAIAVSCSLSRVGYTDIAADQTSGAVCGVQRNELEIFVL